MFNFLKVIPVWAWLCIVGAVVSTYLVHTVKHQAMELGAQEAQSEKVIETNLKANAEIKRQDKDAVDKSEAYGNILAGQQTVSDDYDHLNAKLAAAVAERDILDVKVAVECAKVCSAGSDVVATTSAPTVVYKTVSLPVQTPKAAPEIDIAWEAYCLESTDSECKGGGK